MISRTLSSKAQTLAEKYPVLIITGPRQSGKTTLIRALFPELPYASLEEPDLRLTALNDPRGFLDNYGNRAIFDEVQRAPDLLSYIQGIVDQDEESLFILSGSQNLLLLEKVTQTLAGRGAVLNLLPFSNAELFSAGFGFERYEEAIFNGHYPRIYDKGLEPDEFYPYYIQMYVERDVRQIKNIGDLDAFTRFLSLCAGRIGQLVNYNSLATDAGISPGAARSWISILETSFVLYQLNPYFRNFNKRLVKSPKLYFYDTGLACSLLGLRSAEELNNYYQKGSLFENLILNELVKRTLNQGQRNLPYFWRDNHGREIDCILGQGTTLTPVEVKSGKTISERYFKNLEWWRSVATVPVDPGYVVYGGDQSLKLSAGHLLSWRDMDQLPD